MKQDKQDKTTNYNEYNSDSIVTLEGLEAIRKRPGMYIGGKNEKALHHLIWEVMDNSVDEFVAGYGNSITINMTKDGGIRIQDSGRGIPVDKDSKGLSTLTKALTIPHTGGKFDKDSYNTSAGLNGIGAKCANALSNYLICTVERDGFKYQQSFERGRVTSDVITLSESNNTGTTIEYKPDDTIFDTVIHNKDMIIDRLRQTSFLNKNLEIILIDELNNTKDIFKSKKGIEDMIEYHTQENDRLISPITFQGSDELIEGGKTLEKIDLEVSFLYEKGYDYNYKVFANKVSTTLGGVHLDGVMDAISSTILSNVKNFKFKTKAEQDIIKKCNIDDIREGLHLIVSIGIYTDVEFEGQTKEKLQGRYIRKMVREISKPKVESYLEENPTICDAIIKKVITARRARESADRARKNERKKQTDEIGAMLGKLSDCRSNNPEECEVFICEGESAGGGAKQGRDGRTQAVLPLKGKPINVLKADIKATLKNEEIRTLATALGCGMGDNCDVTKLRYNKIINQMDADIDGSHIQQLILTVFNTLFKPLLEGGYIYNSVPPLHRVKVGKESQYLSTDKDKEEYLKKVNKEALEAIKRSKAYKSITDESKRSVYAKNELKKVLSKHVFNRFKGLGEMNPEQLAETTMHPATRNIIQLKPNPIYNISDEVDLARMMDSDIDISEDKEIFDILKRRKDESTNAELDNKKKLPELSIDNIIALISSDDGLEFRREYLKRNISRDM